MFMRGPGAIPAFCLPKERAAFTVTKHPLASAAQGAAGFPRFNPGSEGADRAPDRLALTNYKAFEKGGIPPSFIG